MPRRTKDVITVNVGEGFVSNSQTLVAEINRQLNANNATVACPVQHPAMRQRSYDDPSPCCPFEKPCSLHAALEKKDEYIADLIYQVDQLTHRDTERVAELVRLKVENEALKAQLEELKK